MEKPKKEKLPDPAVAAMMQGAPGLRGPGLAMLPSGEVVPGGIKMPTGMDWLAFQGQGSRLAPSWTPFGRGGGRLDANFNPIFGSDLGNYTQQNPQGLGGTFPGRQMRAAQAIAGPGSGMGGPPTQLYGAAQQYAPQPYQSPAPTPVQSQFNPAGPPGQAPTAGASGLAPVGGGMPTVSSAAYGTNFTPYQGGPMAPPGPTNMNVQNTAYQPGPAEQARQTNMAGMPGPMGGMMGMLPFPGMEAMAASGLYGQGAPAMQSPAAGQFAGPAQQAAPPAGTPQQAGGLPQIPYMEALGNSGANAMMGNLAGLFNNPYVAPIQAQLGVNALQAQAPTMRPTENPWDWSNIGGWGQNPARLRELFNPQNWGDDWRTLRPARPNLRW